MKNKSNPRKDVNPAESSCCMVTCLVNMCKKKSTEDIENETNKSLLAKNAAAKRNRQDNQLTLMTICVALFYIICSVPMCLIILLPNLIWDTDVSDTKLYKHFAAICNSLELIQCSVRFFIYYFFTTQFRVELRKIFSFLKVEKKPQVNNNDVYMTTVQTSSNNNANAKSNELNNTEGNDHIVSEM